jgi:hypothetical protein
MQERPRRLVVAVNLLNIVDAVMTTLAVHRAEPSRRIRWFASAGCR